jgi:hypothetical protein
MMKISLVIMAAILAVMGFSTAFAGQVDLNSTQAVEIRDRVCIPYLNALKTGDVQTIIAYSGGDMYERYKVLLEQNSTYPQVLRDHYKDAEFQLGQVFQDGDDLITEVIITFASGSQAIQKLRIAKAAVESDRWNIVGTANDFSAVAD